MTVSESTKNNLFVAIPAACTLGLFIVLGQYVATVPQHQVSVSGMGETKIAEKPTTATINLGVQTGRVETSVEAMSTLEASMNAVVEALQAIQVSKADIQTSMFNLYPAYDWVEGEQMPKGYEASQNVTVKVRNPEKVGEVISAATEAGANNVSGVTFSLEDLSALKEKARRQSIAKAKAEAQKLADELDMRLGKLIGYGEDVSLGGESGYGKGGYGGGGDEMVMDMVSVGEQEYAVRVYLTYELR